jgi:pimeloyl-ACP methyl ester carboxylesterase
LTHRCPRGHDRPTLAYLHGFASGPGSTKARFFAAHLAARGATLRVPDLAPDFTRQTVTGMLAIVEGLLDEAPAVLLGSSLGGYLATLAAARRPERVRGLVLFAPAFGFAARWEQRVGREAMARWRARGTAPVHHHGAGRELPLAIDLLDDAHRHPPTPDPRVPTLVFAGRRDESVPLADVARWTDGRPRCELVVFDSDHELTDVLDPMWERAVRFLADLDALEG